MITRSRVLLHVVYPQYFDADPNQGPGTRFLLLIRRISSDTNPATTGKLYPPWSGHPPHMHQLRASMAHPSIHFDPPQLLNVNFDTDPPFLLCVSGSGFSF